jgi:hypothetical protein
MFGAVHESGYGPKRTSNCNPAMSACDPKRTLACLFCRDAVHGCRSKFVLDLQGGGSRPGR